MESVANMSVVKLTTDSSPTKESKPSTGPLASVGFRVKESNPPCVTGLTSDHTHGTPSSKGTTPSIRESIGTKSLVYEGLIIPADVLVQASIPVDVRQGSSATATTTTTTTTS